MGSNILKHKPGSGPTQVELLNIVLLFLGDRDEFIVSSRPKDKSSDRDSIRCKGVIALDVSYIGGDPINHFVYLLGRVVV